MKNIKKKLLIFLIILCSLLFGQENNSEFRSTWVITWEYINSGDSPTTGKARIDKILDNHVAANMNAVLFQVRQSGTAYYNSSYEPYGWYAGYSYPGYDPLAYAIEQAHLRGLELHAWFNTFQTSSTHTGTPAAEHPEWICINEDGEFMPKHRCTSPGLQEVRDYTINVAMEIVRNYDIDGLHLDYVRWNEYDESNINNKVATIEEEISTMDGHFNVEQLDKLHEPTGTKRYYFDVNHPKSAGVPSGYSSWEEWWRWSVTEFVKTLHDSIQKVKPHVRLSAAALGKYNWSGWQGYGTVYQDAALWFNEGYIDQLTPMHYHWTTANSFYDMLTGNGLESWQQWIQPGIDAGRLYSVGPGSYRFDDNNAWDNHPSIVNKCRTINWTDGFQFFSNGSWEDQQYWEEAGHTFFGNKTKIRAVQAPINTTTPNAPSISINKVDNFNYELTIDPGSLGSDHWIILYRSETETVDPNTSTIVGIFFGDAPITHTETFDGYQSFNGEYRYGATIANRFWMESNVSSLVNTENIPSYSPTILSTNPVDSEILEPNQPIQIEFSKEMDPNSFSGAISFNPAIDFTTTWSTGWENYHTQLEIEILSDLPYATPYTMTIDGNANDIIGLDIDANGDGIGGDSFSLEFTTSAEDVTPPTVDSFFPSSGKPFDTEDVIAAVFNELVDHQSIVTDNISLTSASSNQEIDLVLTEHNDNISVLNLRSFSALTPNTDYTLTLASIKDTAGNEISSDISYNFTTNGYEYSEKRDIDDFFSDNMGWWEPQGSGSTVGIIAGQSGFGYTTSNYLPGSETDVEASKRKSAFLKYTWDESAPAHLLREHCAGTPANIEIDTSYTLQCFVYGDGSNNQFRFSLYETGPNVAEVSKWITIDWVGWKMVEWNLSDTESVGSWIGNKIMDGTSYHLDGIHLTKSATGNVSGEIFLDDLRIVKKVAVLGINVDATIPKYFELKQNYPNPFNSETTIPYSNPNDDYVSISVFNLLGQQVKILINKTQVAGLHTITWDGTNNIGQSVPSGVYYYQISFGKPSNKILRKKLLYLK